MLQNQALYVMKKGDSVFLTGPAGSGKTYVLNELIRYFKKKKKQVAITASTGIAATHIGGTTIHSWSGLGIKDSLSEHDRVWLKNNDRLNKRYNSTEVLIIDEVSMLHGKRLDMLNQACKLLRGSDEPFGGLQVILTGDLFQLPPVNREGGKDDFAHLSAAWNELNPKICYLSEQHRQSGDALLDLLNAMRNGEVGDIHHEILTDRIGKKPDSETVYTQLFAHNIDVEAINDRHLKALDTDSRVYEMETTGSGKYVETLQKSVLAPELLELKIGAEVMFVANNFAQGYVNGSRGTVEDFEEDGPVIRLHSNGKLITAEPHTWSLNVDGKERSSVIQYPLRLAWAITIHKSQGMSLDGAVIDLGRSFTYGMGYVALSRIRSMEGLFLSGINRVALQLHPEIFEIDAKLRQESAVLAEALGEIIEELEDETEEVDAEAATFDKQIYDELTRWRLDIAKEKQLPAFMISHNTTLENICRRMPENERQLLSVSGVGKKFVDNYGPEVLSILQSARVSQK